MEQEYNSFNIIYCKEVSSGLQCNNSCGTIEYRGEKYTIKKSAYYVKKKLQNVDVYRSDGIISYTKSEVESDKKLANYYNRENEMCIFSKRNVHFLCFFSRFPSSFLMDF